MGDWVLRASCYLNHLAKAADFFAVGGRQLEADALCIHNDVPHPAKYDVYLHWANLRDVYSHVQGSDESRGVAQLYGKHLAVGALGFYVHQPNGRFKLELRDGVLHGYHAGFEQDGGDTDAVVAAHGRVYVVLLEDDEPIGRFRVFFGRWDDDVGVLARVTAWLREQQLAVSVHGLHECSALVSHAAAVDRGHPADDDAGRFARTMRIDDPELCGGGTPRTTRSVVGVLGGRVLRD
mmetsp:Transcript_24885/g.36516  ORF Transcript_24885/g.36516 Transcript_24885/m.36516 type:complete len:236 (-) Transcript_24885:227-934(-)